MAFCSLFREDVRALKTENAEIGAKGFRKGSKSMKIHSSLRIRLIVFMF